MCGIIGLHLKNPDLQPRLGELLTQMLEAMTTRGPDSAGIAVYSDHRIPPWPTGQRAGTALLAALGRAPRLGTARQAAGRRDRQRGPGAPARRRLSPSSPRPPTRRCCWRRVRPAAPQVSVAGWGQSMVLVKDVGAPADICARYGIPGWGGLPGRRPHPDGHRVGRDDRALAPVRPRRRPGPGAQRLVLQLRHGPPPAGPRGRSLRHRQRLRGRRPADRQPDGRRGRTWRTRSRPCSRRWTASSRCW